MKNAVRMLLFGLVCSACERHPGSTKAQFEGDPRHQQVAPRSRSILEERFAEVAVDVPQFAGFTLRNGVVRVYVTEPEKGAMAWKALLPGFQDDPDLKGAPVEYIRVSFSYEQLQEWRDRLVSLAMEDHDIVLVGIDYDENKVLVGMTDARVFARIRSARITRGIPANAIHAKVMEVDLTTDGGR